MSAHLTVVDQVAFRPLTFRPACTTCDWTGTETELNGDAIKEGASHEETPDQGAPVDDLKARLAKVKSGDEVTVLTRQGCTVVGPVKEASGFLVLDGRVLRLLSDGSLGPHYADLIDHAPQQPPLPTETGSHVITGDGVHRIRADREEYPWTEPGHHSGITDEDVRTLGFTIIWPEATA